MDRRQATNLILGWTGRLATSLEWKGELEGCLSSVEWKATLQSVVRGLQSIIFSFPLGLARHVCSRVI